MRLTRITLPSVDPDACVAFYRDVMQLPTRGHRILVGWTEIEVEASAVDSGVMHLAFNVPFQRFGAARAWLAERAMILRDPLGEECFTLGGVWQSESVYFAGPHDAVLELIARRPLEGDETITGVFHGSELTCVSEVGLPTDDVPTLVRDLVVRLGMPPFGELSDVFAPMGDHEGLLIVVDRARRWFPQGHHLPGAIGVRVTMEGAMARGHFVDANGWVLTAVTTLSPSLRPTEISRVGSRMDC